MVVVTSAAFAQDVFSHPRTAQQLLSGELAIPSAALHASQVTRGEFVFRRYLDGIPQPLLSHGDFTFARNIGIDWHTRQPFDSDFVLTASGITQRDEGRVSVHLDAGTLPSVRVIAGIFLSLLSLDVRSLQDSFALSGLQSGSQWQIGLRPIAPVIASVFKDAIISGGNQVERLVLHDANGDRSEIEFNNLQYFDTVTARDRQVLASSGNP